MKGSVVEASDSVLPASAQLSPSSAAYAVRTLVTVAPLTTIIRNTPVEVRRRSVSQTSMRFRPSAKLAWSEC